VICQQIRETARECAQGKSGKTKLQVVKSIPDMLPDPAA